MKSPNISRILLALVLLALVACAAPTVAPSPLPATSAPPVVVPTNTAVPLTGVIVKPTVTVVTVPPATTVPSPQPQMPDGDYQAARKIYSPDVAGAILRGTMITPSGFDQCMVQTIGQERLDKLRTGLVLSTCTEKDTAALCLQQLKVPPESLEEYQSFQVSGMLLGWWTHSPPGLIECISGIIGQDRLNAWLNGNHPSPEDKSIVELASFCLATLKVPAATINLPVKATGSSYKVTSGSRSGFFKTGQTGDILLSGVDFNNTGGPLRLNDPSSIASDGKHLFLSDRHNNRVLIWNRLPQSGQELPDLVLGQPDFVQNNPGIGRLQLNWPSQVKVSKDGRVVLADTENDRILVWNTFPTRNQQPADLVLSLPSYDVPGKQQFGWPWGVWTDGTKLVASATRTGQVLVWKNFPAQDNQRPDLILTGGGKIATPRQIFSDGNVLIVGEHGLGSQQLSGNYYWLTFPTAEDQPYDFYMPPPNGMEWLKGDFSADGRLITVDTQLHIWNSVPKNPSTKPDLTVLGVGAVSGTFRCCDDDVAIADGKFFLANGAGNRVLVYDSIPTRRSQKPDFAIGSPDTYTDDALDNQFIIPNPAPASNGKSLFVIGSGPQARLFVYKSIPDQSGAHPDIVYQFPSDVSGIAIHNETLALAGSIGVFIWKKPPLNGERPDLVFRNRVGNVQFPTNQLTPVPSGLALDDRYFYLSDEQAGKIYVWEGIPTQDTNPKFILDAGCPVGRLSSDGKYLAATCTERGILLYKIAELGTGTKPTLVAPSGAGGTTNLPEGAIVADGHLFVADTVFNRVLIWSKIEDAIANKNPDVILGTNDYRPEIGKDKLFWPGHLSFDGQYLWVGEFKFSNRLLRFSVSP